MAPDTKETGSMGKRRDKESFTTRMETSSKGSSRMGKPTGTDFTSIRAECTTKETSSTIYRMEKAVKSRKMAACSLAPSSTERSTGKGSTSGGTERSTTAR